MDNQISLDANPDPFYNVKKTHLHQELANVFTKKRIQIIETIHKKKPKTIGHLAKILQRNISAVYRDLKILENHEIVLLEKQGKSVKPILRNTSLTINLVHDIEDTGSLNNIENNNDNESQEKTLDYIG